MWARAEGVPWKGICYRFGISRPTAQPPLGVCAQRDRVAAEWPAGASPAREAVRGGAGEMNQVGRRSAYGSPANTRSKPGRARLSVGWHNREHLPEAPDDRFEAELRPGAAAPASVPRDQQDGATVPVDHPPTFGLELP